MSYIFFKDEFFKSRQYILVVGCLRMDLFKNLIFVLFMIANKIVVAQDFSSMTFFHGSVRVADPSFNGVFKGLEERQFWVECHVVKNFCLSALVVHFNFVLGLVWGFISEVGR